MKEKLTYESLLEKIASKQPFSFTRYGDGEWNAIFGKEGANCDNHKYFPELGIKLANCLKENPQYFLGMQNLGYTQRTEQINSFLKTNNILEAEHWSNADILHHASIKGKFSKFFEAINNVENVILVAPEYIMGIYKFMTYNKFVRVPEQNCFNAYNRIYDEIFTKIKMSDKQQHTVVLLVASMPANILVHDLFRNFGQTVSLLDIGSVLDPFVGKATRSYHRNMNIKELNS